MHKFPIKKLVKESLYLTNLYICISKILGAKYINLSSIRSEISIFDINSLAEPIGYYPRHFIKENDFYGNGDTLFNALNISKADQRFYKIEHGLFLGSFVQSDSYNGFISHIITFSDYRKEMLRVTDKQILCVGPYIQYAKKLLSFEEHQRLKKTFGRVLLVFPSHSIDSVHVNYDILQFIEYIDSIKHNFDNVIVCMYWKDILLGQHIEYKKAGYNITTAGHINDAHFLSRLKSIINLSDATMSNKVGTHIGYCISMDKPHLIYRSSISHRYLKNSEKNARKTAEWDAYNIARREIEEVFGVENLNITDEQVDCVRKYWGYY